MKVTLCLLPVWQALTPPLNLAYLKSNLERNGFNCSILDFSPKLEAFVLSPYGDVEAENQVERTPELVAAWADAICKSEPDVIGFSILFSNLKISTLVAAAVRERLPSVFIVSGGNYLVEQEPNAIERALSFSNCVLEGEGETALPEILKTLQKSGDISSIPNLWMLDVNGKKKLTSRSMILQDLNTLAYPDFSDFDRSIYKDPESLPFMFSRGCILNCSFCTNKWNHYTQRTRTGLNVFREFLHQYEKYGFSRYIFNDDSLISHVTFNELEIFCDLLLSHGFNLPWRIYGTRIERKLTENYIRKLRDTGLSELRLGVESFSSNVQKHMGKSGTFEEADRVVRAFADSGIKTDIWLIYGYPMETEEDFEVTLNWLKNHSNKLRHVSVNPFCLNAKYINSRPGQGEHYGTKDWQWRGAKSTLEIRKIRFLRLMDMFAELKASCSGQDFSFNVGDPFLTKYFTSWDENQKAVLLEHWKACEATTPTHFNNQNLDGITL